MDVELIFYFYFLSVFTKCNDDDELMMMMMVGPQGGYAAHEYRWRGGEIKIPARVVKWCEFVLIHGFSACPRFKQFRYQRAEPRCACQAQSDVQLILAENAGVMPLAAGRSGRPDRYAGGGGRPSMQDEKLLH
jgi:hypothetical protein